LTFLKRAASHGPRAAYFHAFKRSLGLILLGFVIHHLDGRYDTWAQLEELGVWGFLCNSFQRNFFQTLTHIGVTALWIMPVIGASPAWRIAYAIASATLFHVASEYGYYEWVMKRPGIDGGPLGFLTWTIPMIVGTLAYDAMAGAQRLPIGRLLAGGAVLMLLGYALACLNLVTPPNDVSSAADGQRFLVEPPFVPPTQPVNLWTMSQRAGSVSYLTFGTGFALAVYALFVLACDAGRLQLGIFRTLGTNALAAYVIHDLVAGAVKPLTPRDSPLWYVGAAFLLYLGICYLFIRYLENNRLYLRL
jgi:hypothetical protein